MNNNKIENFSFVEATLHWMFTSLTEISHLSKERTPKEIELINSSIFKYYRISLHYMFIMEYIKLMENDNTRSPKNHYGSLDKLSNAILKDKKELFRNKHEENLLLIANIKTSEFFKKLKLERDRKFAHLDSDSNPFSFKGFNDLEINDGFSHIDIIKKIMDNCTSMYDYSFSFQHTDNRTDNFIKFHSNYKRYYYDHYLDAINKGYH